MTRDEIHKELWKDGEFVEFEHAVNTAIRKIRLALDGCEADSPRIIETLPKKGYRFIAPVDIILDISPPPAAPPAELSTPVSSPPPPQTGEGFALPISVGMCRVLFLLAQVPYVATYLAVFYHWYSLDEALLRTFITVPVEWGQFALQFLALLGFAVRIYLIGLVGWGHTDAGPRYRKLFPFLLFMDGLWAATPLLVQESIGPLPSWAGLILMGWLIFGQRTLMRSIELSISRRSALRQIERGEAPCPEIEIQGEEVQLTAQFASCGLVDCGVEQLAEVKELFAELHLHRETIRVL